MISTYLLFTSVLLGSVSYRLWRLMAIDQITEPLRYRLFVRGEPGRLRVWLDEMTSCAWCLGFWISGVISALWISVQQPGWSWWTLLFLWPASSVTTGVIALLLEEKE